MWAVDGSVTHPFIHDDWTEGAIVLEWKGGRRLVPCEKIEASKEDWTVTRDWNSSFAGKLTLPVWGPAEDQEVEGLISGDSDQLEKISLELHGLATSGNSLYLTKAGQLSDAGLLLCLGEMRINLTGKEGGDREGKDSSEWCAAKVSSLHT